MWAQLITVLFLSFYYNSEYYCTNMLIFIFGFQPNFYSSNYNLLMLSGPLRPTLAYSGDRKMVFHSQYSIVNDNYDPVCVPS